MKKYTYYPVVSYGQQRGEISRVCRHMTIIDNHLLDISFCLIFRVITLTTMTIADTTFTRYMYHPVVSCGDFADRGETLQDFADRWQLETHNFPFYIIFWRYNSFTRYSYDHVSWTMKFWWTFGRQRGDNSRFHQQMSMRDTPWTTFTRYIILLYLVEILQTEGRHFKTLPTDGH